MVYALHENEDSLAVFEGRVLSIEDGKPILFAHIVDINRHKGAISDTIGIFSMKVDKSSILRISAVGFKTTFIDLTDSLLSLSEIPIFYIERKIHQISEINIMRLRWEDFHRNITTMTIPDNVLNKKITWYESMFSPSKLTEIRNYKPNGISFTYNNKKDKKRIKVRKLKSQEWEDSVYILPKYNINIVRDLTDLEGDTLFQFIRFCGFKREYLLQATEYSIIRSIQVKYLEFIEKRQISMKKK